LVDIKIDEQRNMMYVLSESNSYIQSYIDIYDLGIYGDIM